MNTPRMITRQMVDEFNARCEAEERARRGPPCTRMRFWLRGKRPYVGPVVPKGIFSIMQGLAEVLPPVGEPWHNKTEWLACMRGMADWYEKDRDVIREVQ